MKRDVKPVEEARDRAGAIDAYPKPLAGVLLEQSEDKPKHILKGDKVEILGIVFEVKYADRSTGELRLREIRPVARPIDPFVHRPMSPDEEGG